MVLQTEAAECGLACLAMIAAYHHAGIDLAEMRRRFGVSLKGSRLSDLTKVADRLDLAPRPLRLELDELDQLQMPCVLHWDLNHFVVLVAVRGNQVLIHDPALGQRRLSLKQVSIHFSGVALEVSPTHRFKPLAAPPRLKLSEVVGRVVGFKRSLGQLFALALAIEVFALLQPFFMQLVVDNALVSADRDLLLTLALGFGLLMLVQLSFSIMRAWMLMVLSSTLKLQGRSNLFSHLQTLSASFFESRQLGDIVSRFGSIDIIQRAMTTDLVEALLDGLMASLTLVIMFLLSPGITLVVLAATLIYGAIRWALYAPLRDASMETIVWAARRDTHFLESVRAIRTIKLLGGQDVRRAHWMNLLVETINRDLTTQKLRLGFRVANGLLQGTLTILVVWMAALLVLGNVFSVGMMLAFIAYKSQFTSRISALIDTGVDLRMLRLHSERLADIVLTPPEETRALRDPDEIHPSLSIGNLNFRYGEGDAWVLRDISFSIAAGESVAIVGASGCGKTTLLKLMSSLIAPTSGEIRVGGEPLSHVGLDAYRSIIGVVLQDDQLLAGSIADNICFFAPQPDRSLIERSARQAAIHAEIVAMPMGYESLMGDMGSSVSGGQKQRILLARALYRKPRILLLDEATSHLDVSLEQAVNQSVRDTQITRIIVAHRPETIRSAQRVITLRDGRIESDVRNDQTVNQTANKTELLESTTPPVVANAASSPSDDDGLPGWQDTAW